jgi:hypothetical protein
MTSKQAIYHSILHWEDMIEWASKQNPDDYPNWNSMRKAINQSPDGVYCALCISFSCDGDDAYDCPLALRYPPCEDHESAWSDVSDATTWQEFVVTAKVMLSQLESLL